jgi:hypothetical protein
VEGTVVRSAERHRPLVADLLAQRARLREAEMMRLGGVAAAQSK